MLFVMRLTAWDLWLPVLVAQAAPAENPLSESWFQYGVLGLVLVGIIWAKVLVPGWVYQAEIERGKQKDLTIEARDKEIVRLRDLMENQTIPMLSRAIVIVERAEEREAWRSRQEQVPSPGGGGHGPSYQPPHTSGG